MAEAKEVQPVAAFSPACERIFEYFPNCLGFLVRSPNHGRPSRRCWQHVDKLNILAKHRTGPRTICWRIQVMVKGLTPSLDPSRIKDLPFMCNTTLGFPISDSMDCSKPQFENTAGSTIPNCCNPHSWNLCAFFVFLSPKTNTKMKKSGLLAASVAAATAVSAYSSTHHNSHHQDGTAERGRQNSSSPAATSSSSEKFAPRFDGLRFIETLVTAHR